MSLHCPLCGYHATTATHEEFDAELDRRYGPEDKEARFGYAKVGRWVIARKSARIEREYGPGVICLSPAKYEDINRVALLRRTDGVA